MSFENEEAGAPTLPPPYTHIPDHSLSGYHHKEFSSMLSNTDMGYAGEACGEAEAWALGSVYSSNGSLEARGKKHLATLPLQPPALIQVFLPSKGNLGKLLH